MRHTVTIEEIKDTLIAQLVASDTSLIDTATGRGYGPKRLYFQYDLPVDQMSWRLETRNGARFFYTLEEAVAAYNEA